MKEKYIIYEQPLNERVRLFLRLEHLFQQAFYALRGDSTWDSRATLSCLTEILEILARSDVKTELLKFLERLQVSFSQLQSVEAVDKQQLEQILGQIERHQKTLFTISGHVAPSLTHHHMINSLVQRRSICGGTSDIDLPLFHAWLQKPAKERIALLENWFDNLETIRAPIKLIAHLLRSSAESSMETAEQGFFQQSLNSSRSFQLVRVFVPEDSPYYAEISGGRHRISIRFLQDQGEERPVQIQDSLTFHLSCCAL